MFRNWGLKFRNRTYCQPRAMWNCIRMVDQTHVYWFSRTSPEETNNPPLLPFPGLGRRAEVYSIGVGGCFWGRTWISIRYRYFHFALLQANMQILHPKACCLSDSFRVPLWSHRNCPEHLFSGRPLSTSLLPLSQMLPGGPGLHPFSLCVLSFTMKPSTPALPSTLFFNFFLLSMVFNLPHIAKGKY